MFFDSRSTTIYDPQTISTGQRQNIRGRTLVLLEAGLSLRSLLSLARPRLQLRLALRWRPLRRGGGVGERDREREA